jgi:hypothetical protein
MDFSKNDLSKARVGDKIWDLFKQEFRMVEEITPNANWPIEFEGGTVCSFGGFAPNSCYIPRYYLNKIEFEIPSASSAPKRMVKRKFEHWDLVASDGELCCCTFETKQEAEVRAGETFKYPAFITYEIEVEE